MYFLYLFILCLSASLSQSFVYTGTYNVEEKVLLYDDAENPVGYTINSKLSVTPKGPNVYIMKLIEPGLHIMSRKAPSPEGFVSHSSKLDSAENDDFIVEFGGTDGLISGIHLSQKDSISMRNLKRAIASAFQINEKKMDGKETDSSGVCQVRYVERDLTLTKFKSHCSSESLDFTSDIWGGTVTTSSEMNIVRKSEDKHKISDIQWREEILMESHLADYSKARVNAFMKIHKTNEDGEVGLLEYTGGVDDIVANILIEIGGSYSKSDLTLENEPVSCPNEKCPQLEQVVKEVNLIDYGSVKSSGAILAVSNAMKSSSKQQIYKVLNSKENKKKLGALLDIAGSVQTPESHQAVLKKLKLNTDNYNLDDCERYLWALSLYPKPSYNITKEIVQLVKSKHHDKKMFATILQTGSSMVHKITVLQNDPNHELMTELIEEYKEELGSCENDDESCRQQYLLALGQTRSPLALSTLIKYATISTPRSGVTALKGIMKLDSTHWTPQVYQLAEHILFSDNKFDSSSRAISLDVLLTRELKDSMIKRMFSLLGNRKSKEINQLILEKLNHKANNCPDFKARISKLMNQELSWNELAQGGLSTSFSRYFMENGYLSTDQEISKGILKRGLVHVNLARNDSQHTLFTLGLFSGGLGSFMSSNDDSNSNDEEEATAGMQIQLLGVEFRPFVFFTGSGDLMGHVWSGTASTKTPAYQAGIVVNRNNGQIPVGPAGVWANLRLDTSASLELAGLIEISLWNRNAHSAVFNRLGLTHSGGIHVNSDFVKTKVDLVLNVEPSLDLTSEIDFSSKVALCLNLYQPNSVIKYNTYKVERIPGSKHKLRKSRYTQKPVPGRTYALNRKNNEMCNKIQVE